MFTLVSQATTTSPVKGMINGYLYTFGAQSITFRSLDGIPENEIIIHFGHAEEDCDVYVKNAQGQYQELAYTHSEDIIWHEHEIIVEHVYHNIDLIIHPGNLEDDHMTYEFIVYPGGNPDNISIESNQLTLSQTDSLKDAIIPTSIAASQNKEGKDGVVVPAFFDVKKQDKSKTEADKKAQKILAIEVPAYERAESLHIVMDLQVIPAAQQFASN